MRLTSVRIITDDVARLVGFYEQATGLTAHWRAERFAELAGLAIGGAETTNAAVPASNRTAIVEFQVDDVDREYARLTELAPEIVQEPTTMPWGNRSLLFRDPDGNLVNFFRPPAG